MSCQLKKVVTLFFALLILLATTANAERLYTSGSIQLPSVTEIELRSTPESGPDAKVHVKSSLLPAELREAIGDAANIATRLSKPQAFKRMDLIVERICNTSKGRALCRHLIENDRLKRSLADRFVVVSFDNPEQRAGISLDAFIIGMTSYLFLEIENLTDVQLARLLSHELYLMADARSLAGTLNRYREAMQMEDFCKFAEIISDPVVRLGLATMRALRFEDSVIEELFPTAKLYSSRNAHSLLNEVILMIRTFPKFLLSQVASADGLTLMNHEDFISKSGYGCFATISNLSATPAGSQIHRIGELASISISKSSDKSTHLLNYLSRPELKDTLDYGPIDDSPDFFSGPKPGIGEP